MKVLYLDHTARVSGAERSLLELMDGTKEHVDVLLACPQGELQQRAQTQGIQTLGIKASLGSFGSSRRELLPAAVRLVRTGLRVRALARRHRVDVIHSASPRAGLIAAFSGPRGPGRVVDVRDALPRGPRGAVIRWLLRLSAHALVFNSSFTRARFGPADPARATVAYPPVDLERYLHLPLPPGEWVDRPPTLGMVGQISPWKGQDDAIRILALVRERVPDARLRIVGGVVFSGPGVTFDNDAFRRQLVELADELGLGDAVELSGQSDDLESIFASIDVLLVPSWEEPFGRVVAEAMAAGVPVVATNRGGPAELIEHGASGYLAEPRDPEAWTHSCVHLLTDPALRARIGERGRRRIASVLDPRESVDQAVRLYRGLTNGRPVPLPAVSPKEYPRTPSEPGVLLVQPFGVDSPGGGGRVFRSLCADVQVRIVSACVTPCPPQATDIVEELHLATRPRLARLRSSRFDVLVRQLDDLGHRGLEQELESLVHGRGIGAIHALADAQISFAVAHRVARRTGARFTLSVWDAPWYKRLRLQAGNGRYFAALEKAWRDADARTAISDDLGEAFCQRYGRRPYVVVTDGLESVATEPGGVIPREFSIYFCGSIHLAHWANFRMLFEAVDRIRRTGVWLPRIVLRGSSLPDAAARDFVEARPWDATDDEITEEISSADILYLPLPFGARYTAFTRLSQPTKLVTYVGSGRPILYHGPASTAAAQVLRDAGAALLLAKQDPAELATALVRWIESGEPAACATRSIALARSRFLRERQQQLFWRAVLGDRVHASLSSSR